MNGSALLLAALEIFPDGAVEWRGGVSCPDPMSLQGASIALAFDFDLDGSADGKMDSIALSPADCEGGEARQVRTLFPGKPALLISELRRADGGAERAVAFAGPVGSLLSIRHFCARPSGGEPEWVELRNASDRRVNLRQVRLQNHTLDGWLEAGESVVLGSDSTAVRRWAPAWPVREISWSYLRNSGDTLLLAWTATVEPETEIVLDGARYGEDIKETREACASDAGNGEAAGTGFDLRLGAARWNPAAGSLQVGVEAPAGAAYVLVAYDLDGFPLGILARGAGPSKVSVNASNCPGITRRSGAMVLNLQPRGAAPVRKILILERP